MTNSLLGYEILPDDKQKRYDITFDSVSPVLLTQSGKPIPRTLNVFSGSYATLSVAYSKKFKSSAYIWGIPSHSTIQANSLPEWCLNVLEKKCYERFRELIGNFVILADEPEKGRISFVSDILGIRPFFLGHYNGRLVFGSDVWAIQKAGLSKGLIDYDSVSAWIAYKYNCTEGTLFTDLHRLPSGAVVIHEKGICKNISYTEFKRKTATKTPKQVAIDIHDIVSDSAKTLLSRNYQTGLALSGGFDSRYLLALSLTSGKKIKYCATVDTQNEDSIIASKVANILRVPLKKFYINGSHWDQYDQVYHYMADGFPITKQVIYLIAHKFKRTPLINGYLGGVFVRGYPTTCFGKYEHEYDKDLASVLQANNLRVRLMLFRKELLSSLVERALAPIQQIVKDGKKIGNVFSWTGLHTRQRYYIPNNFLQHLDYSEALLPFYSWELLSYYLSTDYRLFNKDTYKKIFECFFPNLAQIPRAQDLVRISRTHGKKSKKNPKCIKTWAKEIIPVVISNKWLNILSKKNIMPFVFGSIFGVPRMEGTMFLLQRMYMLEKKMKEEGIDFDWDNIR